MLFLLWMHSTSIHWWLELPNSVSMNLEHDRAAGLMTRSITLAQDGTCPTTTHLQLMLHTALHGSPLRSSLLGLSQGSSSCCRLSSILQQQQAPRLGALPLMTGRGDRREHAQRVTKT